MRKINRVKALLFVWCVILCFCIFVCNNAYMNVIILSVSMIGILFAFMHICEKLTDKEKKFINKF